MPENFGVSLLTPSRGVNEVGLVKPKEDNEEVAKKPFVNSIFDANAGAYAS